MESGPDTLLHPKSIEYSYTYVSIHINTYRCVYDFYAYIFNPSEFIFIYDMKYL